MSQPPGDEIVQFQPCRSGAAAVNPHAGPCLRRCCAVGRRDDRGAVNQHPDRGAVRFHPHQRRCSVSPESGSVCRCSQARRGAVHGLEEVPDVSRAVPLPPVRVSARDANGGTDPRCTRGGVCRGEASLRRTGLSGRTICRAYMRLTLSVLFARSRPKLTSAPSPVPSTMVHAAPLSPT